jgi:hypothetical protein
MDHYETIGNGKQPLGGWATMPLNATMHGISSPQGVFFHLSCAGSFRLLKGRSNFSLG